MLIGVALFGSVFTSFGQKNRCCACAAHFIRSLRDFILSIETVLGAVHGHHGVALIRYDIKLGCPVMLLIETRIIAVAAISHLLSTPATLANNLLQAGINLFLGIFTIYIIVSRGGLKHLGGVGPEFIVARLAITVGAGLFQVLIGVLLGLFDLIDIFVRLFGVFIHQLVV